MWRFSVAVVFLLGCGGGDHFTNLDAMLVDGPVDVDAGIDAGPDLTAPVLLSTSPATQESGVGTTIIFTATFDEAMDPASAAGAIVLSAGSNVAGTVSVDGAIVSFTPDAPLTGSQSYTATIDGSISDLAGNLLGADHQIGFTTRAGGWSAPATIEPDATKGASELTVDANGTGGAVAAWVMRDCSGGTCNGQPDIWTSVYNGTWSSPSVLVTGDISVNDLDVVIDDTGNATLVWNEYTGSTGSVRWSRFTSGGSWSSPALLENDDTGNTSRPRVTVDPAGNVMAVWEQRFGGLGTPADLVWSRRAAAGSTWTSPTGLEATTPGQLKIELASAPDGSVVAIWEPTDSTVRAAKYVPGSGWSVGTQLKTNSLGDGVVQAGPDSNFVVAYRTGTEVWSARLTTSWSTAVAIDGSSDATVSGCDMAISSGNRVLVTWLQGTSGAADIWQNRMTVPSAFGVASRVDQLAGAASMPSVAYDASGTAMAVWVQTTASIGSIESSSFSDGTGWGTPQLLELSNTGNATRPYVVYDADNNAFVVVWLQNVTGYMSVYTSTYQ